MIFEDNQAVVGSQMDKRGDNGYGMMKPGQYAGGTIASIQNDESGNPAWIVSRYSHIANVIHVGRQLEGRIRGYSIQSLGKNCLTY